MIIFKNFDSFAFTYLIKAGRSKISFSKVLELIFQVAVFVAFFDKNVLFLI